MEIFQSASVGFLCIGICLAMAGLATFLFYKKEKRKTALCLLVLSSLLFNLLAISDTYLHEWDERFHTLVAKNLAKHPLKPTLYDNPVLDPEDKNYQSWTGNHIWVHKPPLALWMMSGSIQLFGSTEFAVRLPSLILSTLAILIVYGLACLAFSEREAFMSSLLMTFYGAEVDLISGRRPVDHIDQAMFFFVLLGVWLVFQHFKKPGFKGLLFIGLTTGAALLTKWLPGLLIPGLFFVLHHRTGFRKRSFALGVILLLAFAIALPWNIYIHQVFPLQAAYESKYNFRHITEAVEGHDHPWFWYFLDMTKYLGIGIWIAVLWMAWVIFKKPEIKKITLFTWFLVPYILFSCFATKLPYFVAIAFPALILMMAFLAIKAWDWIKDKSKTDRHRCFACILLLLLICFPVAIGIRKQRYHKKNHARNPTWVHKLKTLNLNSEKAVLFNTVHPINAMFYTGLSAYPRLPTREQVRELDGKGYLIYLLDDKPISDWLKKDERVNILSIEQ